jgi:hypothetical protein
MDTPTPPAVDPIAQVETPPASEATSVIEDPKPESTPVPPTPEQAFFQAYNELVKATGYELTFEAKPILEGEVYDFGKVRVQVTIAKKA